MVITNIEINNMKQYLWFFNNWQQYFFSSQLVRNNEASVKILKFTLPQIYLDLIWKEVLYK